MTILSSPPATLLTSKFSSQFSNPGKSDYLGSQDVTVRWTASISKLCRNGQLREAASQLTKMMIAGRLPNHVTLTALLSGCSTHPTEGKFLGPLIHGFARKLGLETSDAAVGTAIVEMYAKTGCVQRAWLAFDHLKLKNAISWNTMLDGYMRYGRLDEAMKLFEEMPERGTISWTLMIHGLVKLGLHQEAAEWFKEMQLHGVEADHVTAIAIMSACTKIGAYSLGLWVHRYILGKDFRHNIKVSNALIGMYSGCGSVSLARQVFGRMCKRTLVTWNSMISGFASNGFAKDALEHFDLMQREGFQPNGATFTAVITACSHAGLIDEGVEYYNYMQSVYKISPGIEHFGCLVDIYCRAGRLEDALRVVREMKFKPNEIIMSSLLAACKDCEDINAVAAIIRMMSEEGGGIDEKYVAFGNVFAGVGRWDVASKVRRSLRDSGIEKKPGMSTIEVGQTIHCFVSGPNSRRDMEKIGSMLHLLFYELKEGVS